MNIEEEIAEWVAEEVTETSEQELIKILNEELMLKSINVANSLSSGSEGDAFVVDVSGDKSANKVNNS